GQIGFGTGLIQEDQAGWIPAPLFFAPAPARPRNVGSILFTGMERLFLYVSPIFAITTCKAWMEQVSPKALRSSARVRSFFLASRERIRALWPALIMGLRPAR